MTVGRRVRLDEACHHAGLGVLWLHLAKGCRPVSTAGVRVLRAVELGSSRRAINGESARPTTPAPLR